MNRWDVDRCTVRALPKSPTVGKHTSQQGKESRHFELKSFSKKIALPSCTVCLPFFNNKGQKKEKANKKFIDLTTNVIVHLHLVSSSPLFCPGQPLLPFEPTVMREKTDRLGIAIMKPDV